VLGRAPDGRPLPLHKHSAPNLAANQSEHAATSSPAQRTDDAYAKKIEAERKTFSEQVNVHDLPGIYHYWSNKYLLPLFKPFGFTCPDSFYVLHLEEQFARDPRALHRIVSVGAGNCDTEIRVAQMLLNRGLQNFVIECLDLNEAMLQRGRVAAQMAGLGAFIKPTLQDFNYWRPATDYSAVIANQSLHHIQELETVFTAIRQAIGQHGVFLTSDMIGRNGHMRWPEALAIVQEFWRELPDSHKYNHQLKRLEHEYDNWDCSREGFEGIRAQDVLPLLIERFQFESFFAFANVIDVFIDRGFGHNFDANSEWDRNFIDRVQARDQAAMLSGEIKPTHILAAMRSAASPLQRFAPAFTPQSCVRPVAASAAS
jgi:SAM-dependent methyltransferase